MWCVDPCVNPQSREVACQVLADAVIDEVSMMSDSAEGLLGLNIYDAIQWFTTVDIRNRQQLADIICNTAGRLSLPHL